MATVCNKMRSLFNSILGTLNSKEKRRKKENINIRVSPFPKFYSKTNDFFIHNDKTNFSTGVLVLFSVFVIRPYIIHHSYHNTENIVALKSNF